MNRSFLHILLSSVGTPLLARASQFNRQGRLFLGGFDRQGRESFPEQLKTLWPADLLARWPFFLRSDSLSMLGGFPKRGNTWLHRCEGCVHHCRCSSVACGVPADRRLCQAPEEDETETPSWAPSLTGRGGTKLWTCPKNPTDCCFFVLGNRGQVRVGMILCNAPS